MRPTNPRVFNRGVEVTALGSATGRRSLLAVLAHVNVLRALKLTMIVRSSAVARAHPQGFSNSTNLNTLRTSGRHLFAGKWTISQRPLMSSLIEGGGFRTADLMLSPVERHKGGRFGTTMVRMASRNLGREIKLQSASVSSGARIVRTSSGHNRLDRSLGRRQIGPCKSDVARNAHRIDGWYVKVLIVHDAISKRPFFKRYSTGAALSV